MQNGEISLSKLSPIEFQTYGIKHAGQFEYRVELASRIASSFGVEHLIIFDDNALTVAQSEIKNNYSIIRVREMYSVLESSVALRLVTLISFFKMRH
jgi:hypothetical protein